MIDDIYRIVRVFRDITGLSVFGDYRLTGYQELKSQWLINAKLERELVATTMLEF